MPALLRLVRSVGPVPVLPYRRIGVRPAGPDRAEGRAPSTVPGLLMVLYAAELCEHSDYGEGIFVGVFSTEDRAHQACDDFMAGNDVYRWHYKRVYRCALDVVYDGP